MTEIKGTVALIGSGEMAATMVETHKTLLSKSGPSGKAFFLDTPAGFQENADLISQRAVHFFKQQVQQEMEIASFKTAGKATSPEGETLFRDLSEARYVLIGPGSPTYTVRQLKETAIPVLFSAMVTRGGTLAVASAAALTVGSHTLPVYEIYKVGEELHWVEGLNILGLLGLDVVVVPHWNNAEGGNHDTRFCYMGEKRFRDLESMLPGGRSIIGLDEHTACILDFSTGTAAVEGLGNVTVRCNGEEQYYSRGDRISFEQLLCVKGLPEDETGKTSRSGDENSVEADPSTVEILQQDQSFWKSMHAVEEAFHRAMDRRDSAGMVNQLLEADRLLWQAQLDLENPEFVSQGRELFRELIVLAGTGIEQVAQKIPDKFNNLVEGMIELREKYRQGKNWAEADQIRSILQDTGVVLEDTHEGPRWHLK